MSGIKQKIKDIMPGTHHKEEREAGLGATGTGTTTTGYGTTTTGQYETPTTGAAGYGVVGDERQAYEKTTGVATTAGEAATCGRESFTKVEDRPRVIEQKVSSLFLSLAFLKNLSFATSSFCGVFLRLSSLFLAFVGVYQGTPPR